MNKPLLTVAVPTFNRNSHLADMLEQLLPQIDTECCVLILDNHSDVPVKETLRPILKRYSSCEIKIIKNKTNIGAVGNIMRCVESCETNWIWILGDDDLPSGGAINSIKECVQKNENAVLVNFSSPCFVRKVEFRTTGILEFIKNLDSYSNVLFTSANIYQTKYLMPYLRVGNHFAHSMAPILAVLLVAIKESDECVFVTQRIIDEYMTAPASEIWSQFSALLGRMTLLELPLPPDVRRSLAKLLQDTPPTLELIAAMATIRAKNGSFDTLYLYDQICTRLFYYDNYISRRWRISFYRYLVRFPGLGYHALKFASYALRTIGLYHGPNIEELQSEDNLHRI